MKRFFILCVGVCFPAESGIATTQGAIECLAMVGMDCLVFDILHGFGMLGTGSHVLGPISTFFMRLRPFVLHPDFCPFLESLAGTPLFAGMDKLMADFEQKAGAGGEGLGASEKEFAILPAALEFPQESTASVHEL